MIDDILICGLSAIIIIQNVTQVLFPQGRPRSPGIHWPRGDLTNRVWVTKRNLEFLWQRVCKGWDDSETWSLDAMVAEYVLPRLKRFREMPHGVPAGLSKRDWDRKLADIEHYLTLVKDCYVGPPTSDNDRTESDKRYIKGRRAWRKYFQCLWW